MTTRIGRRTRRVAVAALGAALAFAVYPAASSAAPAGVGAAGLDCNETAHEYQGSGYVYFYSGEKCEGGNGAKDNSGGDSDHGDDAGQVKGWDNQADSIVNTTDSHVEFYNYPDYNRTPEGQAKGDRFCLGPGEWINALQYYGDAGGDKDWWRDSISSHREVSASECTRWFGWGTDRE